MLVLGGGAMLDRRDARPVAEMAGDDPQRLRRPLREPGNSVRHVAVAQAVKSEALDSSFRAEFLGQSVASCACRQRRVERCVEHGHVRHAGKQPAQRVDELERQRRAAVPVSPGCRVAPVPRPRSAPIRGSGLHHGRCDARRSADDLPARSPLESPPTPAEPPRRHRRHLPPTRSRGSAGGSPLQVSSRASLRDELPELTVRTRTSDQRCGRI